MGIMGLFGNWFGRNSRRVPSPEENRARRAKFEQMVRSPDWAMVAEVLGDLPPALRSLYGTDMVLQSDWTVVTGRPEDLDAYEIGQFEALRRERRKHVWPDLRNGCLTFAGDGFGNHFFLKARTGPQWPVHFYDHEGGDITQIADSLDEFLGMLQPTRDDEA